MAQDTSRRMHGLAALGGAVLLGSTFLTSPVAAQSVDELKAQIDALSRKVEQLEGQQVATPVIAPAQAVTAGDFPGSIKLPGTNTSFKVGGYVKFDLNISDMQGLGDSFFAAAIPAPGAAQEQSNGHTRMHARQTRFNIQTRTPTDMGEVRTYIEGDFYGAGGTETVSNSTGFRLRQAYGTIGNLLVGQTWGNFMMLGTLPDTIDFAGPAGVWFTRQAMIKYTVPFDGGLKLEVSAENPQSLSIGAGASASGGGVGVNDDIMPDFTAKLTFGGSWGFVSGGVLVGMNDINTLATNPAGATVILDDEEFFWAVQLGARVNTWGKDSIAGSITYTEGGGRTLYPFGVSSYVDTTTPGAPSIENIDIWGAQINYEHWWTDNLYSTVAYGITDIDWPGMVAGVPGVFAGALETVQTVHVNLQWIPVPNVTLGVEYALGIVDYVRAPGSTADNDNTGQRLILGAKFAF